MTLESNANVTNELILGAEALAAGRTLGLTDDETLATRRATIRRNIERRRADRENREGNRALAEQILAENDASFRAKGQLTEFERQLALGSNVSGDIDDQAWAFGEDAAYEKDLKGIKLEKKPRRPQDDNQSYTREEKVRNDVLGKDFLQSAEQLQQNEGRSRQQVGIGGMRDALNRLEMAKDQYGFAAFGAEGPEMERLYYRLKEDLGDNQQRIRDQSAARDANNRDQRQANVLKQLQNDQKAAADAEKIRNRGGGLPRQLADEDIGNIAEVRSLGVAGGAGHGVLAPGNYQVVRDVNPASFERAIPLIGKDGMPIAHFERVGDQLLQLGNDVNSPDSSNALNAPKATPMQEWVVKNQPAFGKNNVFGEPQVEVNDLMQMVGDRVRGLQGFGYEGVGNPRTFGEFDQMINAVAARGQKLGKQFFRFDKDQKKNIGVTNPGVDEVMNLLRIPPSDREKLAWALRQQQLVNQPVKVPGSTEGRLLNEEDKELFARREDRPLAKGSREGVVMNAAEMRADGGTPIDMITNERFGRGKNAKGVRAALAAINDNAVIEALYAKGQLFDIADKDVRIKGELIQRKGQKVLLPEAARLIAGARQARNDAQMPMQGAIKGEKPERARFIRGDVRGLNEDQLMSKFGPQRGVQAAEVQRRAVEDESLRRKESAIQLDPIAIEQRKRDSQIADVARKGSNNAEDRVIGQLYKDMRYGREFDAPADFVEGKGFVPGAKRGEVLRVPPRSSFVADNSPAARAPGKMIDGERVTMPGRPNFRRPVQETREAPVPMSIAPEPGAGTGNQPAPMVDAGGSGLKPPTRRVVGASPSSNPQPESQSKYYDGGDARYDVVTRFDTDPFRSSGFADPNPQKTFDDTINQSKEVGKKVFNSVKDFATSPRHQRGRRVLYGIGGGTGALATILNLVNKEEEQV